MAKKKITWIPVVTAIIRKSEHILVGQRPKEGSLPGVWELPGGKIEPGELPEDALKRELHEELGIDAEIGKLKFASSHSYGDVGILILFYDVSYWKSEPKSVHHTDIKWVTDSEMRELSLPDANREVLERILQESI